MPELPEVQTVVTDLKAHIVGYKIKNVFITGGYNVSPNNEIFKKTLIGSTVKNSHRIAKNILIELDSGYYLTFHLAMTGRILLRDNKENTDSWVKVELTVEKDNSKKFLRFADVRMFGKVGILDTTGLQTLQQKYGPEPIDENTTPEIFLEKIKSKRTSIKNVLLDQHYISGLGNIYATDALFLAKIHPESPTQDFTLELARKLLATSKEMLQEGIRDRGSTLPDKMYVDIFGNSGSHQEHFRIYMKDKCDVCGTKVEITKINGRGTYFCPKCQIKPAKLTIAKTTRVPKNQTGLF